MIIIRILLKITGFTQEQLAQFLGISRATVNYWINGENISESSKRLICEKFNFPIKFFDATLDENIEIYKIIYATIYNNWTKSHDNQMLTEEDKINHILNELEIDSKSIYTKDVSDEDIKDGLINGYDPYTGEIFDESHILSKPEVKKILQFTFKNNKSNDSNHTYDELSYNNKLLYDKLKKWRFEQMQNEGFFSAYMVFNNRELINIIESNITDITDLLKVKGIGKIKYEKYSKDIFKIIKEDSNYGNN